MRAISAISSVVRCGDSEAALSERGGIGVRPGVWFDQPCAFHRRVDFDHFARRGLVLDVIVAVHLGAELGADRQLVVEREPQQDR